MEDILKRMLEVEEQGEAVVQAAETRAREIMDASNARIAEAKSKADKAVNQECDDFLKREINAAEEKAARQRAEAEAGHLDESGEFIARIKKTENEIFQRLVFP